MGYRFAAGFKSALCGFAAILALSAGQVRAEEPTIRVFTGSTAHWADLVVANEKGFFKEEGIQVEPTYFTTGAAATESFLAGRGDIVLTCELASVGMWKKGSVVGISRQARLFDQEFLVVRGDVETPKDLEGKTVATRFGSTVEYFLRKLIADEGLDPSKINIINLEPADMVVALDSGSIQGYANYIPFPQLSMRATKDAKILATSGKYIQENCIYSATRTFAEESKPLIVSFLRAIRRGGEYVEKNVDESAQIVAAEFKGKAENMKLVMEGMDFAVGYDRDFRRNMQAVSDFFDLGPIDWSAWFDPSALQTVAPDSIEAD
ncbi:MAG: ABC transporter substrate-binding protein [Dongiaceae bacterium]